MDQALLSKDKLFDQVFKKASGRTGPLHAQVREAFREIIGKEFVHGEKFLSEPELIQRLGVSQSTVRRALLDLTAEGLLIRKVPTGTFVNKVNAGFSFVGVFIPCYDSLAIPPLLEHIMRVSRDNNLSVVLHHTYRDEQIAEALSHIQGTPSDTRYILLSNSARSTRELYRNLSKKGYHTVNVDSLLDNYPGDFVGVDNESGMDIGLRHLADLGHRRIWLLVNESTTVGNVRRRVRSFHEVATKLHLDVTVIDCKTQPWASSIDAAYDRMDEVWNAKQRPTALMTISDAGSWGVLKWLAEHEVRVPQEISVLGFGGISINRYMHPELTSVAQPWEEIANEAMDLLIRVPKRPEMRFCKPRLASGQSTGPCPQTS